MEMIAMTKSEIQVSTALLAEIDRMLERR